MYSPPRRPSLRVVVLTILALVNVPAEVAPGAQSRSWRDDRTLRMTVTAYCPCKKCCGRNARGITASGKRVSHNRGRFVAADTSRLPLGARVVVPGYHEHPVEVIDTGGAIKGNRLDVFFQSHEQALKWGRRVLDIQVIETGN